jgi:hypothetical protein
LVLFALTSFGACSLLLTPTFAFLPHFARLPLFFSSFLAAFRCIVCFSFAPLLVPLRWAGSCQLLKMFLQPWHLLPAIEQVCQARQSLEQGCFRHLGPREHSPCF